MNNELLIERVKRWGGMADEREAECAIRATLQALREGLFDDEAGAVAAELSDDFARVLRSGAHRRTLDRESFYQSTAHYEGLPPNFAIEHAQAVCEALASVLSPPSVERLRRALPELAELFAVTDRDAHPPTTVHPHGRTLAEGHPGSDHPLSDAESPPRGGRLPPASR